MRHPKGSKFPRCYKCKMSILKMLDGRCLQKETNYLKPIWVHTQRCVNFKKKTRQTKLSNVIISR